MVPIVKETKEAMKGETTDFRKRELAAVCIGVNTPNRKIGIKYHTGNFVSKTEFYEVLMTYYAKYRWYKPDHILAILSKFIIILYIYL